MNPETAVSSSTTPTVNASVSSILSDDYLSTDGVLADMTSSSPIGVYTANGVTQALFIRSDGVLCQLSPSTSASGAGGWSVTSFANTTAITSISVGLQDTGALTAFYTDANNLYQMSLGTSSWGTPNTLPLLTGVSLTNNAATGELIAAGVDANGDLGLVTMTGGGTWGTTTITLGASIAGTTPVMMMTDASNDWIMALQGPPASSGGTLSVYQGTAGSMTSSPVLVSVPNPVSEVILAYTNENAVMFLFNDSQNNLYSAVAGASSASTIPNVSVAGAAAIVDAQNALHVYLIDPSGVLSVLHQTGWSSSTGPSWAPNLPLNSGFQLAAADLTNSINPASFFAADEEGALYYCLQDQTSGQWSTTEVQTSGTTTYNVAQYRSTITFTTSSGSALPNFSVSLTASTTSAVLINGVLYPIAGDVSVSAQANGAGQLTFSTIASSISAPVITVAASGFTTMTIDASSAVRTYLGGTGTLNSGGANSLPLFSATTLQQATVGGQPLAPAVTNNSTLASQAFSGISATVSTTGGSSDVVGWILDLSDKEHPSFHQFTDRGAFEQGRAAALPFSAGSSFWDEIAEFADDFWEGLKNGVIAISKWVVDAEQATISFLAQIGGGLQTLANIAISGVESVAAIVHSIFAAIGAALEEVVDWLKWLFDWSAIWNTKLAFTSAIQQAITPLTTIISNAENDVDTFFDNLKTEVTNTFAALELQWTGNLSTYVPVSSSGPTSASSLEAFLGAVQNNWLLDKVMYVMGGDPSALSLPSSSGVSGAWTTFTTSLTTAWTSTLQSALSDFSSFVTTTINSGADLGTTAVSALLTAVETLVLAVIDAVQTLASSFLALLSAGLADMSSFINVPIPYPFLLGVLQDIVSSLGVSLPAPSILDLFTLAIAIPVTLVYELITGSEPFPGGNLPTDASPAAGISTAQVFALVAGILTIFWGVVDAIVDGATENVKDAKLPVQPAYLCVAVLWPLLIQIFTWPGPFTTSPPPNDITASSNFNAWIFGSIPPLLDLAAIIGAGTLARYVTSGMIAMTLSGLASLSMGAAAIGAGNNGDAQVAGYILSPLPTATMFLKIGQESMTPAVVLKCAIDAAALFANGVTIIVPAFNNTQTA